MFRKNINHTRCDASRRESKGAFYESNKRALVNFGIEFAVGRCKELLKASVPGLHFYTMDRSEPVVGIVNRLRADDLL